MMMQCEHCGKYYEARKAGPGPQSRYCSRLCRIRRLHGHSPEKFSQEHTCEYCGKTLNYPRQRRFCSPLCAQEHKRKGEGEKACEQCGKKFSSHIPHKKYCSTQCANKVYRRREREKRGELPKRHAFVCKHCGKEYKTAYKDRNTYCSRECSFKDKERRCACGASLRGTGKARCDQCDPTPTIPTIKQCVCVICGKAFGAERDRKYCSDECVKEKNRRLAFLYNKELFEAKVKSRECKECGAVFTPEYGMKIRNFCSQKCSKRFARKEYSHSGNHQQRAKRYGVKYKYFSYRPILRRDGWRCYVCGIATPPSLRGSYDDRAPEIDHVVPLSKGGAHTKDNVRCCCRHCNALKSDMTLDEMERAYSVILRNRRAYATKTNEQQEAMVKRMLSSTQALKVDELALLVQGRLL